MKKRFSGLQIVTKTWMRPLLILCANTPTDGNQIALGYYHSCDINGDCKVDFKDFAFMAANWLKNNTP